jgi:hypothetical protein
MKKLAVEPPPWPWWKTALGALFLLSLVPLSLFGALYALLWTLRFMRRRPRVASERHSRPRGEPSPPRRIVARQAAGSS